MIEEILREAKENGASDVHITVGLPPKMRLNGKLIAMENYGKMMPADTNQMAEEVMNEKQREKLEENGQHDMSFSIVASCNYNYYIRKKDN